MRVIGCRILRQEYWIDLKYFPQLLSVQLSFHAVTLDFSDGMEFSEIFKFVSRAPSLRSLRISAAVPQNCDLSQFECFSQLTSLALHVSSLSMQSRCDLLEILPPSLTHLTFNCANNYQCLSVVSRRFRSLQVIAIGSQVCVFYCWFAACTIFLSLSSRCS